MEPMHGDVEIGEPRAKRAKYALVACVQCKRRKTKCNRAEGSTSCGRCLAFGDDCTFPDSQVSAPSMLETEARFERIESKVAQLQHQVQGLQTDWSVVGRTSGHAGLADTSLNPSAPSQARRRPHFVGRTRPAFSFDVAGETLRDMGVSTGVPPFSRDDTPDTGPGSHQMQLGSVQSPLLSMEKHQILQHIDLFTEEVHPVYPFVDISALRQQTESMFGPSTEGPSQSNQSSRPHSVSHDTLALRVVVAIGTVMKLMDADTLSQHLVQSVEAEIFGLAITSDVRYAEAIATALLGLYYFHTDQELLAWRVNGIAARMMLEMGLHRKDTMMKTFPGSEERSRATQLFWCIYVLDRRWSFGISLPFAVQDADIDPNLPEPGEDLAYLQCMVKYGRTCSQIWQALPSFGEISKAIPEETVSYLEFKVQSWINSIPGHLRLAQFSADPTHSEAQNRIRLRLATLLYLRGNHATTLVNRHALLSRGNIRAYSGIAQRVVNLAKDSIRALVQLNASSEIYVRQQVPFNYFLLSALAIIFLAVCHDPSIYGPQCEETFFAAVEQLQNFSLQSLASKRLWKSISHLIPEAQKLGLRHTATNSSSRAHAVSLDGAVTSKNLGTRSHSQGPRLQQQVAENTGFLDGATLRQAYQAPHTWNASVAEWHTDASDPTRPGIDQMASELTNWYDCFGTTDRLQGSENIDGINLVDPLPDSADLSQLFGDLISG